MVFGLILIHIYIFGVKTYIKFHVDSSLRYWAILFTYKQTDRLSANGFDPKMYTGVKLFCQDSMPNFIPLPCCLFNLSFSITHRDKRRDLPKSRSRIIWRLQFYLHTSYTKAKNSVNENFKTPTYIPPHAPKITSTQIGSTSVAARSRL